MTTRRGMWWVLGAALGLAPGMMPAAARAQAPAGAVREVEVVDGGYRPARVVSRTARS